MAQTNDTKPCTDVQEFENPEFGTVRALTGEDGEPWFVASDVAKVLGYSNPRKAIIDHVDDEDKGVTKRDTLGGTQNMTVINESGLYSLVLSSKLPKAKDFKRWVTHEVLPSIRRHGAYATDATIDHIIDDPDFGIRLLETLKTERDARRKAEQTIEEQRPKVLFADAVAASDGTCLVGELAKMLRQNGVQVGQNRLFARLREDGWLGKSGGNRNVPTQKAMERGLFRIKETAVTHSDGHVTISRTAKVTGAGQRFFVDLYGTGAKPLDGLEARDEAR
ncbi:phage antirepressor KilAC domain-containing protein [Pseudoscardovia suis]